MPGESPGRPARDLLRDVSALTEEIAALASQPNAPVRENVRKRLVGRVAELRQAVDQLDPVLRPLSLFDPGDPLTAGRIIALTTVAQPRHSLAELKPFYGAGVYALYYRGSFAPYAGLSETEQPIYVGKANPDDQKADDPVGQGKTLYKRLTEHAKNIERASTTLSIADFDCRFLLVQSGFQQAAETHLINFFQPIWNSECNICYGLGKHGDSSDTRKNKRSPWDTLHPGRQWAEKSTEDQKPRNQIIEEINSHLERYPPKSTVAELVESFTDELRQVEPSQFRDASGKPHEVDAENNDVAASDHADPQGRLL